MSFLRTKGNKYESFLGLGVYRVVRLHGNYDLTPSEIFLATTLKVAKNHLSEFHEFFNAKE